MKNTIKNVGFQIESQEHLSIWPFISAISVFLIFIGILFYFVYNSQLVGTIIIGASLAIIVFSSAGWTREIFYIGRDEKLGARGTIWFICAETIIFGVIIVSFISARVQYFDQWILSIPKFNYYLVGLLTLILWTSSYTIWKAKKSLENNNLKGYQLGLILTILLGSTFLAIHAYEWTHLWEEGFTISSSIFGTIFYSLTGIHASHVLVGILIQIILLINSNKALGYITPIKAGSLYWHFVDIAWLLVASTAYLLGGYGRF
ncbi:MAG: heme-copper oxidase subunit III [Brevinematales bacterium]|nr:heme-copper oxidase subunit III [Brevinematales bacterium]